MKFKIIVSTLIFLIFTQFIFSQETPKSSEQILDNAFKTAQIENKNVFVVFKASWCGWCKKMESNINNEAVNNYFTANYEIVYLTVLESANNKHLENPGAEALLIKYEGNDEGIPFYLIFDSEANLLADSKMIAGEAILKGEGDNIGCPASPDEVDAFIYKIQQTSNLKPRELKLIAQQFLVNK